MGAVSAKVRPQDSAKLAPLAVSKQQAAAMTGLSVSSLEKRVDEFVTIRVGRRVLFPVRGLEAWLDCKISEAASTAADNQGEG